jgi:hypothetical protein
MQTAYIAEVDTDSSEGTRYIGLKGKLVARPYFFRNSTTIREVLQGKRGKYYGFIREKHLEKTTVVIIKNLENGLRASEATRITGHAFLAMPVPSKTKAPKNAVYKIELDNKSKLWRSNRPFVGSGKFGTTWQRAGDVRLHLNNNLGLLISDSGSDFYKYAKVLTIVLGLDGITPVSITKTPIIDWYCESPRSKARWYEMTRTSIGNFEGKTRSIYG